MSAGDGPKRLGDILGRVLAKYGYANVTAKLELEKAWAESAGDAVAQRTRVGGLRRGVLEILVDNPVLIHDLDGFQKAVLLEKLQSRLRHNDVRSLRFRRS